MLYGLIGFPFLNSLLEDHHVKVLEIESTVCKPGVSVFIIRRHMDYEF